MDTQIGRIDRYLDLDWVGADASIQRAIALDPGQRRTDAL
jgi:hypothetical protein